MLWKLSPSACVSRTPEGEKEHLLCLTWKATEKLMFWVAGRNKLPVGFSTCSLFFGNRHFNLGIFNSRWVVPLHPPNSILMRRASKKYRDCNSNGRVPGKLPFGLKNPSISWLLGHRGRVCRRGSLLNPGARCLLFLTGRRGLEESFLWWLCISGPSSWCTRVFPYAPTISCFFFLPFFLSPYSFLPAVGLMFVFPPKFLCWGPNPQVLVFGGVQGRSLGMIWFAWGHRVEPHDGIGAQRDEESRVPPWWAV